MQIKFCGITNYGDASFAASLGVDYLGFIVDIPSSPRSITVSQFFELAKTINANFPEVKLVAVVKEPGSAVLEQMITAKEIDVIQFHDSEIPIQALQSSKQIWQAIGVKPGVSREDMIGDLTSEVDLVILDNPKGVRLSPSENLQVMGTKLQISRELRRNYKRFAIAGGVTSENVLGFKYQFSPTLLDVASGIESSPGKKDHLKMAEVFELLFN